MGGEDSESGNPHQLSKPSLDEIMVAEKEGERGVVMKVISHPLAV